MGGGWELRPQKEASRGFHELTHCHILDWFVVQQSVITVLYAEWWIDTMWNYDLIYTISIIRSCIQLVRVGLQLDQMNHSNFANVVISVMKALHILSTFKQYLIITKCFWLKYYDYLPDFWEKGKGRLCSMLSDE